MNIIITVTYSTLKHNLGCHCIRMRQCLTKRTEVLPWAKAFAVLQFVYHYYEKLFHCDNSSTCSLPFKTEPTKLSVNGVMYMLNVRYNINRRKNHCTCRNHWPAYRYLSFNSLLIIELTKHTFCLQTTLFG